MKIKKKAIVEQQELELVDPPLVKAFMTKDLPNYLASVMEAWKIIGNRWNSCMEAELELYSKDKELEKKLDINAVRSLVYMGFMLEKKGTLEDCWVTRYKLSKTGLKALGASEDLGEEKVSRVAVKSLPEKATVKPVKPKVEETSTDCRMCGGEGLDDAGDLCDTCYGTGTVTKTSVKTTVRVKRK